MRKPSLHLILSLLLPLAALQSCGDDTRPGVTDDGACAVDGDCAEGEVCAEGECVLDDGQEEEDSGPGPVDSGDPDVEEVEGEPEDPGPQTGDPCDSDDDCPSGQCVLLSDGRQICTEFCTEGSCPEGFECTFVENSGADSVFLCFPEAEILCKPCEEDVECGGRSDLCVTYENGSFCGRNCADRDCPEGFDCARVEVEGGEPAFQCLITTRYCCAPTNGGVEACDGIDNNCDGQIDEDFDLTQDATNCGACGLQCELDNAQEACEASLCVVGQCEDNFFNINIDPTDGCEYACALLGDETCNGNDDNCDGLIDEAFDFQNDVNNCGGCFARCILPNATPRCQLGLCRVESCSANTDDCNGEPEDGCEVFLNFDNDNCGVCGQVCDPPNADGQCANAQCRVAQCDGGFNDCDRLAESGCESEAAVDVDNCGFCGLRCAFTNAVAACRTGECALDSCLQGFHDIDGNPANGCEYRCDVISEADDPDPAFLDLNCDGTDGDVTRGVFVAPFPTGRPDNLGTLASPVNTLARGLEIAAGEGKPYLLVAEGLYNESVTLVNGISIFGGYRVGPARWTRAAARDAPTVIGAGTIGLRGSGIDQPTTVENVQIVSQAAFEVGASSYAVHITNANRNLILRGNIILAGNGANGGNGAGGANGPAGGRGGDGEQGCDG